MRHKDVLDEKHKVGEQIISTPSRELDHGIVKDWDSEESGVRRK
jgi:hypothetical protein